MVSELMSPHVKNMSIISEREGKQAGVIIEKGPHRRGERPRAAHVSGRHVSAGGGHRKGPVILPC